MRITDGKKNGCNSVLSRHSACLRRFSAKKSLYFMAFLCKSFRDGVALRLHGKKFFHAYGVDLLEIVQATACAEKNPPWHPLCFSAIATASACIRTHGMEFFLPTAVISFLCASSTRSTRYFFFRFFPIC